MAGTHPGDCRPSAPPGDLCAGQHAVGRDPAGRADAGVSRDRENRAAHGWPQMPPRPLPLPRLSDTRSWSLTRGRPAVNGKGPGVGPGRLGTAQVIAGVTIPHRLRLRHRFAVITGVALARVPGVPGPPKTAGRRPRRRQRRIVQEVGHDRVLEEGQRPAGLLRRMKVTGRSRVSSATSRSLRFATGRCCPRHAAHP